MVRIFNRSGVSKMLITFSSFLLTESRNGLHLLSYLEISVTKTMMHYERT